MQAATLSEGDVQGLKQNFDLSLTTEKGPYSDNFCICEDGAKEPVAMPDGVTVRPSPCDDRGVLFCSAFRAPHAVLLAEKGLYLANLFSRDLYNWDGFSNHHDLVRGYILEDYFVGTHPDHKFALLRAYGGLSGAEYEAPDAQEFFEKYLALPEWTDFRHYLLSYELQRRYFVRPSIGQIQSVRNLAVEIEKANPKFKLVCDAIHNRISPALIPRIQAFRDELTIPEEQTLCNELITEIDKLTRIGEADLAPQINLISDPVLRTKLEGMLPTAQEEPVASVARLGAMMVLIRQSVANRSVKPPDARKLIDLAITSAAVVHSRTTALLDEGRPRTVREGLELLQALTDAAYGAGLLSGREHDATAKHVRTLLGPTAWDRTTFYEQLQRAGRIVEWAQNTVRFSFAEVMPVWTEVMPDVAFVGDDILRASPLLVYAQVARRIEEYASRELKLEHQIFGQTLSSKVRALNPGLALGELRFAPPEGGYARKDIVALLQTPPDLAPVSGIITQGEGNVVSHVQLLARSLGIPNIVLDPELMQKLAAYEGKQVFYLATPLGRVFLKELSHMSQKEHEIYAEYTRNQKRGSDGKLGLGPGKLHIDRAKLDLSDTAPVDLRAIRRRDSGVRSGPKAAFLGELKAMFPDRVSRGIVLPFGIYYEHYRRAKVSLPDGLRRSALGKPGEPLHAFVERTYAEFFGKMLNSGKGEAELAAWIKPRLEVIQYSIRQTPISPSLRQMLWDEFRRQGLLVDSAGLRTVGCFVRSDTNVEDLENFNGAGLNLTIFNLTDFERILDGIKEVWASPFTYRSFSWRQALIDEPLWVLPSIVILESVPSEKSGVLISADVQTGDPSKMTVATSEGVGGAVDGSPAETLLWSASGIELLAQFKSPWRRMLKQDGGVGVLPSTGREGVLTKAELEQVVSATQTITAKLEPERDAWKRPRPWDIEFGFVGGKLWLFQVRAFVGNDAINNIPALRALDQVGAGARASLSLEEVLQ